MLNILKSRTVWTIIGMFVIGGTNAITPFIPADVMPFVQGALALLGIYFRVNPRQEY